MTGCFDLRRMKRGLRTLPLVLMLVLCGEILRSYNTVTDVGSQYWPLPFFNFFSFFFFHCKFSRLRTRGSLRHVCRCVASVLLALSSKVSVMFAISCQGQGTSVVNVVQCMIMSAFE